MRLPTVVQAMLTGILIGLPLAEAAQGQLRAVPRERAEIQLSFAPVVKRAAPAVVNVFTRRVVRRPGLPGPLAGNPFFEQFFRDFGGIPQQRLENSLGSGVILRADGIVVTNAHVIADAVEIRVALADRREYDAKPLLIDRPSDLAILQLDGARDLPVLPIRGQAGLEVGDLVLAIGNPFGVGQTVTSGIISALARSGGRQGGYFIQTDAAVNPGNSGGALVDMAGNLIGVNTAILTRSGGSVGIGFAIPGELVAQAVETALTGGQTLSRPWAGIRGQAVTADIAEALGMERPAGVVIADIHPLSPLRAAGLRVGDVVIALDGEPVQSPEEFSFRLATLGIGGRAEVTYLRDGRRREARMDLVPPPRN